MQNQPPFHGRMRVKQGYTHTSIAPFRTAFDVGLLAAICAVVFQFFFYYPLAIGFSEKIILSIFVILCFCFAGFFLSWLLASALFVGLPSLRFVWALLLLGTASGVLYSIPRLLTFFEGTMTNLNIPFEPSFFIFSSLIYIIPLILFIWFIYKTMPLKRT